MQGVSCYRNGDVVYNGDIVEDRKTRRVWRVVKRFAGNNEITVKRHEKHFLPFVTHFDARDVLRIEPK